jgi:hypothetical protein
MRYFIIDNLNGNKTLQTFRNKKDCRAWLMKGLYETDGAERDHYVSMLSQLDMGKKVLEYNAL